MAELDLGGLVHDGGPVIAHDSSGTVRIQGPASGTSAVFWARHEGEILVSDRQEALYRRIRPVVNRDELVVRLTEAQMDYPFSEGVIWDGVNMVHPGNWLRITTAGDVDEVSWWRTPDPDDAVESLSPVLHDTLLETVSSAASSSDVLSMDLSGGLDSTTLVYTARQCSADINTLFFKTADASNSDCIWSDRAARDVGSRHRVYDYASMTVEENWDRLTGDLFARMPEGPSDDARHLALVDEMVRLYRGSGTVTHVNGHGGDELFAAMPAMAWSMAHSHVRRGLRDVFSWGQMNKFGRGAVVRHVMRHEGPESDLLRIARGAAAGSSDMFVEGARWVPAMRLPGYLTAEARERFSERTLQHAGRADLMLHPDRTSHQVRGATLHHGALIRRTGQMVPADSGVRFASPYLDDRVTAIAMRLRIADRFRAGLIKPLLAAARPENMPVDYFQRRDKGEYSFEKFVAFSSSRTRIRGLLSEGSVLADMGLIDLDTLNRELSAYSPDGMGYEDLLRVEMVERWLRSFSAGH
ncbi:asparagine synthase-related protein [uncultured Propionibacterium sp.]|uniref:asparagine synthase-related protein n=1 Tax=uncultured Propionibacterium sp. TaxID=218066 RepID=UPI0029310DC4|nr:asparagine synthase-related protein [uncultured Propionibacterium sp.]